MTSNTISSTSLAVRQLGLFAFAAVAGLAALMWGLNLLANLTASASGANSAVDAANNAITVLLREEPPQLDSTPLHRPSERRRPWPRHGGSAAL